MNIWILIFGTLAIRYNGQIPLNLSFERYGVEWIALRAISEIDAKRQADTYALRKHPMQDELDRIARAIRVLAAESEERALVYFRREYPPPIKIEYKPKPKVCSLKLEAIGLETSKRIREMERFQSSVGIRGIWDDGYKPRRPWVAEIIGLHPKYVFNRSFLKYNISYEEAEYGGDRGVYFLFEMQNDRVYQVNELITKKVADRYFCKIESGELIKISEDEVIECLKSMGLA